MFYSRKASSGINHTHERALKIVYKDNTSSFKELLKKDKSLFIHHKNIQSFAIELFKVKSNLPNRIMCNIFKTRNLHYNLRSNRFYKNTCQCIQLSIKFFELLSDKNVGYCSLLY